jgi:ADP-heptose:LPS heptosyltransferase
VLQRGPALAAWPPHSAEIRTITILLEEAAQLRALDLLISVDTLSAHLAGALGVRTWTLLPASADWRWMDDREDTLWYPTMRLFRQPEPGDWKSVISRLRKELELLSPRAQHARRTEI